MRFSNFVAVFVTLIAGQALAGPVPDSTKRLRRQDDAFSNFASGKGSETFGNAGTPCTVGNDEGECDQFGRCAQFIPPNENSILNQGRPVAECTAGGVTGVL